MTDLVITPASVKGATGANSAVILAGEAVDQGQPLYLKTSDQKLWMADADAAATAVVKGLALCSAEPDQPVKVQSSGEITLGAILTVGQIYCLSATAGAVCPYADLASGDFVTILGVAKTTSILTLTIINTGIAKA